MKNHSQTNAEIGEGTHVDPDAIVGLRYHPKAGPARIGAKGIIRAGAIIYGDVVLGDYFQSGHHVLIRAKVRAGNYCAIGNHTALEGLIHMGEGVRIMHHVYIPSRTWFGNHVFVGPGVMFLNDKMPGRYESAPEVRGAFVEDEVVIGGGCVILPGVRIGEGSFVAAGALVTKDIPPRSFAKGSPARIEPLPEKLNRKNDRTLTEQTTDLWHPLTNVEALKWPSEWPCTWEEKSSR